MPVHLVSDTSAELPAEEVARRPISLVPAAAVVGQARYTDFGGGPDPGWDALAAAAGGEPSPPSVREYGAAMADALHAGAQVLCLPGPVTGARAEDAAAAARLRQHGAHDVVVQRPGVAGVGLGAVLLELADHASEWDLGAALAALRDHTGDAFYLVSEQGTLARRGLLEGVERRLGALADRVLLCRLAPEVVPIAALDAKAAVGDVLVRLADAVRGQPGYVVVSSGRNEFDARRLAAASDELGGTLLRATLSTTSAAVFGAGAVGIGASRRPAL